MIPRSDDTPGKRQPTQRLPSARWVTGMTNPVILRLGLFPALTVRGRRSGQPCTVPIGGPFEFEGARYLVSCSGSTSWASDLREAGGGELRMHGTTESFRSVEVIGEQRDRVIAAYRRVLGRAVNGFLGRLTEPADHPVFRIEPARVDEIAV